jgi:unsaturated chondroitin disaccharide hydrolase
MSKRHARATARAFFRPDGSTYHLVRYDSIDGSIRWRGTFQGANDRSCWSRGQAWGIAGFAWAWLATGEQEFRDTAERAARYFMDTMHQGSLPPWDFGDVDEPDVLPDASAGAITALGLLILASAGDGASAEQHRDDAKALLIDCAEQAQNHDTAQEGILPLSCYSRPHSKGVYGATAWGDFYYGLALALATGRLQISDLVHTTSARSTEGGQS